jgi:hypothetical protein
MKVEEDVASVLEQETHSTIARWLVRVETEPDIIPVRLTAGQRCAHLPAMFRDLIALWLRLWQVRRFSSKRESSAAGPRDVQTWAGDYKVVFHA